MVLVDYEDYEDYEDVETTISLSDYEDVETTISSDDIYYDAGQTQLMGSYIIENYRLSIWKTKKHLHFFSRRLIPSFLVSSFSFRMNLDI